MSSIIHSQVADIPSNMTTTGFGVTEVLCYGTAVRVEPLEG
jgi:hypothetical protein